MDLWRASTKPLSLTREASKFREFGRACNSIGRSVLEQNGMETAIRICFDTSGICSQHSTIFFPTRFKRKSDPRGYLQTSLGLDELVGRPCVFHYDGSAMHFTFRGEAPGTLTLFVSPSMPTVWALITFDDEKSGISIIGKRARKLIQRDGDHTIWRDEKWTSPERLEIAFTCVDQQLLSKPLVDLSQRELMVGAWLDAVQLDCPETDLVSAIQFAKIRTCESVFRAATVGVVHSPGGGMFYSGVWCNDQAEYAAPILVMLGEKDSLLHQAAINSLRVLATYFDRHSRSVPYSVEVDGGYIGRLDRGDAGMFAWGASLLMLTSADLVVSRELFPHIKFACEAILAKMEESESGIVSSESDELEGRFPTGSANLSVNCISILALESASEAAKSVNEYSFANDASSAAARLRDNAHRHFRVADHRRYQYYRGCREARGWGCLAALARLPQGKQALQFTLNDMWGPDGIYTAEENNDVWDRCSLYAIRTAYIVGCVETATTRLLQLVKARLKRGAAAPYMQENNTSHAQLAAESALLIRVITEGLLGIQVRSGRKLLITPRCPATWPGFAIRNIYIASCSLSFTVAHVHERLRLTVETCHGIAEIELEQGESVLVADVSIKGTPNVVLVAKS